MRVTLGNLKALIGVLLIAQTLLLAAPFRLDAGVFPPLLIVIGNLIWLAWLVIDRLRPTWTPSALALFLAAIALFGLARQGTGLATTYAGLVLLLASWDLNGLYVRHSEVAPFTLGEEQIIGSHLAWLGLICLASLLGFLSTAVELTFNFDRTLILGLSLMVGLSYIIRQVRRYGR